MFSIYHSARTGDAAPPTEGSQRRRGWNCPADPSASAPLTNLNIHLLIQSRPSLGPGLEESDQVQLNLPCYPPTERKSHETETKKCEGSRFWNLSNIANLDAVHHVISCQVVVENIVGCRGQTVESVQLVEVETDHIILWRTQVVVTANDECCISRITYFRAVVPDVAGPLVDLADQQVARIIEQPNGRIIADEKIVAGYDHRSEGEENVGAGVDSECLAYAVARRQGATDRAARGCRIDCGKIRLPNIAATALSHGCDSCASSLAVVESIKSTVMKAHVQRSKADAVVGR